MVGDDEAELVGEMLVEHHAVYGEDPVWEGEADEGKGDPEEHHCQVRVRVL